MIRGLLIAVLFVGSLGCVGGGAHLSIDRDNGSPTGTPTGEPGEIPPITGNWGSLGSGGGASGSESFREEGGTFVSGGRAAGDLYRMVAPEMSLGQRKIGSSE